MQRLLLRAVVLALAALACFARPAAALDPTRALSQYVHRIWQVQQGLPQASIYAIAQGSEGYLWLGTQGGLVGFDGVRFTTFDNQPLAKAWVQTIVEDAQQRLWVGTRDRGLFCIARNGVSHFSTKQGLPSNEIRALAVDAKGEMWIGTASGAARLVRSKVTAYGTAQGLIAGPVTAISEASDGTIWLGGHGTTISVWNGAGFARYTITSVPDWSTVQSMLRASDGTMWIGTSAGLLHLAAGREHLYTTRDGLAADAILDLAEPDKGSIWAGTGNGFSRLRGDDVQTFRSEDGLSQSTVYSIFGDREGSVWVGTKHGLNQFLDGRTIPFTTKEGLPTNDTGPVLQDRNGIIWVGTLTAGLARFDGRRFTSITTRDGLRSNTVRSLAEDARGDVWAGTDAGLTRIRSGTVQNTYTTAQGLPANEVRALFVDRRGVLWVGTSRGATTIPAPRHAPSSLALPVVAFAEDAHGRMLEAVGGRVYAVDSEFHERALTNVASSGQSQTPGAVDALYADSDGGVWIGTDGNGLWLLDGDRLVHYTMQDGLFDDQIYGMVADNRDRLWMACSKGVFVVERAALLKFAAGSLKSFSSTPYSSTDALRTIESRAGVDPVVWRMAGGRLWFSTIRGLTVIDPNRPEHSPPPRPVVEDVIVNGQRTSPDDLGTLAPSRNNVTFRYSAPGFIAPNVITFRYLLEGFDRSWTNAGTRREAFYTNLPHGSFLFRLSACNAAGACVDVSRPVAFSIAPRVYERDWFIPLCAALLALIAWLVYELRMRRLRAQFGVVLAERARIARELHDTLIQGFSGITMEMQALLGRLRSPAERTALEEIIDDAGTTLHEARQSLAGLRSTQSSHGNVAAAIEQTARQLTAGKDVRLKLRVDENVPMLPAEVSYNLVRIAREAIANAVTHSGAAFVEVALSRVAGGVELSVKDAGEGFEGDEHAFMQRGHYGLAGMRERAAEIGAGFAIVTEPGRGTSVTVKVPVRT